MGSTQNWFLTPVRVGLGQQEIVSFLVQHEATFGGQGIQRHLTVLVLTPGQLLICHTDDGEADTSGKAITTAEAVALRAIDSASITRSIEAPQDFPASAVAETWLSVTWGGARRLDIGPAGCEDPSCEADHGWTGMQVPNDFSLRMSPAADGADHTQRLLEFGAALQSRIR